MRSPSGPAVFAASVSGQAAGLVMLSGAMVIALARGKSILFPLQVFTALIVGEASLHRISLSTVVPGFLAHQAGPCAFWSRLFGLVVGLSVRTFSLKRALLLGVLVGAVALIVDGYLLMPGIQKQLNGHDLWAANIPRWNAAVTHLIFGGSLGFFYWRWQPRHRKRVRGSHTAAVAGVPGRPSSIPSSDRDPKRPLPPPGHDAQTWARPPSANNSLPAT